MGSKNEMEKLNTGNNKRRFVVLGVTILTVAAIALWAAWSFAVSEEETIHIFPSNVTSTGWDNADGALEQALSGEALISDFNADNSAFIILDSEEETDTPSELIQEENPEGPDAWDGSTEEEVLEAVEAEEQEKGVDAGEVDTSTTSPLSMSTTNPHDGGSTWFNRLSASAIRVFRELSTLSGKPVFAQEETATPEPAPEPEPTPEPEPETTETPEEPVSEETPAEEAVEEAPEEETSTPTEEAPETETEEETTTVEENETNDEEVAPETSTEELGASPALADLERSETESETTPEVAPESVPQENTTASSTTEEETEIVFDIATSSDEEELIDPVADEVVTSTEAVTVEETEPSGGGSSNDSEEGTASSSEEVSTSTETTQSTATPESSVNDETTAGGGGSGKETEEESATPEDADDDVTICAVTGVPCHVLEFGGFSIGATPENDIQNIGLRLSFGAEALGGFTDDKLYIRYFTDGYWYLAGEITVNGIISNNGNGDHFSFHLPELSEWEHLDDLKIQLEFVKNSDSTTRIFLDSLWLDTTYEVEFGEDALDEVEDNVVDELQALEDSASPDILVIDEDEKIEFEFTDDTKDENLIIKSDKQFYSGITKAKVFFNVTNESERQDDFHLQAFFPRTKGEVLSIKKWTKNIPKEKEVPQYAEVGHFCEANWREAPESDGASASSTEEFGRGGTLEDGTEVAGEEEEIAEAVEEFETTTLEEEAEATPEEDAAEVTQPEKVAEEESEAEISTEEVEASESVAKEETPGEASEEQGTSTEDVESETEQDVATSSEEAITASDEVDVIEEEEVQATTEDLREIIEETARDLLAEVEAGSATSTGEAARYYCPNLEEFKTCDSLNEEGTNCIVDKEKIGSEMQIEYEDDWMPIEIQEGEAVVDQSVFTRVSRFFGGALPRKAVDPAFVVKDSTAEVHRIEAGQTLYFEMEIYFPPQSDGEFWIEAIGKKGAYGLLDPWWDSAWSYRLPVTLDNSNYDQDLIDYTFHLEMDTSVTSDFWNNVNSDGSDIRFLEQVAGSTNWYNAAWQYRIPIEIRPERVGSDLTNFPVYVDLSDLGPQFFNNLNDDGGDIRVTTSNGTSEVPREVVYASTTTDSGELHFRATNVSSSATTTFYIYYGNASSSDYASTTLYGARNVWTNGYDYVHHFHENPSGAEPQLRDSTVNMYDATTANMTTAGQVAGNLGNGVNVSIASSSLINGVNSDLTSYTYSAWLNIESGGFINGGTTNLSGTYFSDRQSNTNGMASLKAVTGSNFAHQYRTDNAAVGPLSVTGGSIVTDTWQYVAWGRASSSNLFIFTDNASTSIADVASGITPPDPRFGSNHASSTLMTGVMDEVRLSSVARNEAWLSAEYVNQASTTNFYATTTFETYAADQFTELDYWIQEFQTGAATSASIWVQPTNVPANSSSTVYLYYGNGSATTNSDPFTPFTHATLTPMYYVVRNDAGGTNVLVASMIDDNSVSLDGMGTTTLDKGEVTTFSSPSGTSVLWAVGPVSVSTDSTSNSDTLVPISFASTTFIGAPRTNNTEIWHMYSPFGSSSVTLYTDTTLSSSISIATGTQSAQTMGVGNNLSGTFISTLPILMVGEYNTGDGVTMYPATTRDLYGSPSSENFIGIGQTATDYVIECSGTGAETVTSQGAGTSDDNENCGSGGNGNAEGVRIYDIDTPIAARQIADGDGGEATSFWPRREFATEFMVNETANYFSIVCAPEIGEVNIAVYSSSSVATGESGTCTPGGGEKPGSLYFGGDTGGAYPEGYYIASTDDPPKPFYAYWEDTDQEDEMNFTAAPQSRQLVYPPPDYSFGTQEVSTAPTYSQDNFRFYANTDAILPTDPWPVGAEDSSENQSAISARSTEPGDELRVRMSVGVTVATSTAGSIDFKLQYAENPNDSCSPTLNWQDLADSSSTTAPLRGINNASVSDGDTLGTLVLTNTDVLGTYEEQNNSAVTPNQIDVGEYMEFDWTVENNNAPLDTSYCLRMVRSDGAGLNTYNNYPEISTNGAPGKTSITDPFDNEKVPSQTPSLQFNSVDDQSDDVDYRIHIATSSTFSSSTMVIEDDSVSNPTRFSNTTIPSDKAPFDSGNTVSYTLQSSLTNNETYWMRVRANDRNGSGQWGEWSTSTSFTVDTSVLVSTWFQTTGEQFDTNRLVGASSSNATEDLRMQDGIGEYGTIDINGETWQTVNLNNTYTNPIVVASTRYYVDTTTSGNTPRDARVRNKTSTSFQIKPDTISTATIQGTTTIDYIVMEAGSWTIDNGTTTGHKVIAGTETNITFCDDAYNDALPYRQVTFDPAFEGLPIVLSTVTSERSAADWFTTSVNDGNDVTVEVSATNMGVALGVSRQTCPGSVDEDIDYIAIDATDTSFLSTNNTVEFITADETDVSCCGAPDNILFTPNFSDAPEVVVTGQSGTNGGDGSWALVSTSTAPSATQVFVEVDEMETSATGRAHTTETAGVWAFNAATGSIRATANVRTNAIDFDNADIGNKWGDFSWTDVESNGLALYQVEYFTGSAWSLIPDSVIPGNSTGTGTSPIALGDVDTNTYNVLRLVSNFSSTSTTPILQDWTLTWSQGVSTPTSTTPFDNEKVATRTPSFIFQTIDPESDDLQYEFSFSTSSDFLTSSTTKLSGVDAGFENLTDGGDTSPFNSADAIGYTIQSADTLASSTTYWWRVRARDPGGDNAWSFWSTPQSFTVDTTVTLSTWFQTTQDQFNTDTLVGVEADAADEVITRVNLGEYGHAHVGPNASGEVTVNLQNSYQNPIVVASPRYYANSAAGGSVQRSPLITNKTSNTFTVRLHNDVGSTFATTVVDYLVMEEGEWEIEDGSSGTKVIAGDHTTDTCQTSGYSDAVMDTITFPTAFDGAPAVLAAMTSNNNSSWAVPFVSNVGDKDTPPISTGMGIAVGRVIEGCAPIVQAETIDYIAFDQVHGTNNSVEFDAVSGAEGPACCSANGYANGFFSSFSTTPQVVVVNHVTMDGAQGGWALTATSTSIGTTTNLTDHYVSMDESVGADRGHATEDVAMIAFADNSGIIKRVSGALSGTITGTEIDFDDGTGPKWGDITWSDTTPGASEILYQLEYFNTASGTWNLVPDQDLPGNSSGTSSQPINISTLGFSTFNMIRPVGTFSCSGADCPTLQDWTVTWSEGLRLSGTLRGYDRMTNINSGTVAVALNGVLQSGKTGSVSAGSWTINNVNAFPDDVITVFVQGAASSSRAVAVTLASSAGQDITGIDMYERHLSIGSDEDTTVTNADIALFDNGASGDFDIMVEVDAGNDLDVCGTAECHDANLIIKADNVYRPDSTNSGDVATHDMIIDGTFTGDGNTVTVNGSWDNNNFWQANTSNVTFTATSGVEIIDSVGSATSTFNNVNFGFGSGNAVFQLDDHLDVDGNIIINYGVLTASTADIMIGGNLTIGAAGGFQKGIGSTTGTTTFDGTGTVTWSDATTPKQDIGVVVASGTTKTIQLTSDVRATNVIIQTGNTIDATASDNQLEVRGDFTNNGVFTARNGQILFSATTTGHIITPGVSSFYDIRFDGAGGNWAFGQNDMTATNDFIIDNGIVTLAVGTSTMGGSFSNDGGDFMHNNAVVLFNSTAGGNTITASGTDFYTLHFNGAGGAWSFTDVNATTSENITFQQGALTMPSGQLAIGGDMNTILGTFVHNNGEVKFNTGSTQEDIRAGSNQFYDLRFASGGGSGGWLSGWSYRLPLTIQSSQVDDDLTNFPVYVDLNDLGADFFSNLNSDGGDIRVTQSDGTTEMPREVVFASTTLQTGELHFRANSVSSTTDTTFYIYYGNSGASDYATNATYGAENVWTNGYDFVLHLHEDPGGGAPQMTDSTSNSFDATTNGMTVSNQVTGKFGNAVDFTSANDYFDNSNSGSLTDYTYSAWIRTNNPSNGTFFGDQQSFVVPRVDLEQNSGNFRHAWRDNSFGTGNVDGNAVANTAWQYVAWGHENTAQTFIVVNTASSSDGTTIPSGGLTPPNQRFGTNFQGLSGVDAFMDELRLSSVARPIEWLNAEYRNQSTSTDFYATSSAETEVARVFVDTNATSTNDVVIDSGLVTFPSTGLSIAGSFTNFGAFNANNGMVRFDGTGSGNTVDAGNSSFYDVEFDNAFGEWNVTDHATATNIFRVENARDFTVTSGQRVEVTGTFENLLHGASTTWTGSTLALTSGTNYTVGTESLPQETYGTLEIGPNTDIRMWNSTATDYNVNTSGSLYSQDHAAVDGELYVFGDYDRTSGTDYWSANTNFDGTALVGANRRAVSVFIATSTDIDISGTGALQILGTSTATTTIQNQGGGTYDLTVTDATINAEYYDFSNTATTGLAILGSSTVTTLYPGAFTLGVDTGTSLTISSTTIDTLPLYQLFQVSFSTTTGATIGSNVTASGTAVSNWWFRQSYGGFDGENNDSDAGNPGDIRWDNSAFSINISGTVYTDEGSTHAGGVLCDDATPVIRLIVDGDGGTPYDTACASADGTYSISSIGYTGDATIIAYLNGTSTSASTITRTPTVDITDFDLYANHVIARNEDTAALTIANLASYDNLDDADIPFRAATGSPDLLEVLPGKALLIWDTKEFAPGGNIDLFTGSGATQDGTLRLRPNSTLTASGTEQYRIGGDWRADVGATFTRGNSLVQFFGATSTNRRIQASSTFYSIEINGSSGAWNLDETLTVDNNLTVTTGTMQGTSSVDVLNGIVTGDGTINMTGGTFTIENSGNFGGATDWTFDDLVLGDGTTASTTKVGANNITIRDSLTIASNHELEAGDDTWTFTGAGAVFTANGIFDAQTSTTTYATSTNLTIAPVTYYDLVAAPVAAGSPTYTVAIGGVNVNRNVFIGNGTNPVTVTADTNDSLVDIEGTFTILTNATYVASNINDVRLAGSFLNQGGLNAPAGGAFVFDSGDTGETIDSGGDAFATVNFNNATGGWTIQSDATSTGAWSISAASSYAHASGTTLEVGGTFTNSVGGAATTWATTTLFLNSATNYTANSKLVTGDTYNILKIGDNTDVRFWNSDASTYDVATTGSLYSQDHSAVDGDLYVFSQYTNASGNDYWSYATDFDGADLASTSAERQVNVYIASSSIVTFSGGTFDMIGATTTGATTTVQNQGAGTYRFTVSGGTVNAGYYQLRDVDGSGWRFTGSPVVTDLSDGDFLVEIPNGTGMTVNASVINANPLKTFRRNKFATSSAIAAFNVTELGAPGSSWRFTGAYGNLAGEEKDSDPLGDPGVIVWDDSDANITVSGNVYSDEGITAMGASICDGSTTTIRLEVTSGATIASTSCAAGTGYYEFNNVVFNDGDALTVYVDSAGGERAITTTIEPITFITDFDLYQDRVIVRHEDTNPITIDDLTFLDSDQDSDIPYDAESGLPDTLVLIPNTKLLIWPGKDFAPGGNVTLNSGGSGDAWDGTLHIGTSSSFVAAGTESHSIGGNWLTYPSASFTAASSSVTFTATTTGKTISPDSSAFYDLTFNGSGGAWTLTDIHATSTNDVTITNGALTMASTTMTVGGSFANTGGTFDAGSTTMKFTSNTSETIQVNGSDTHHLVFEGGGTYTYQDTIATTTGDVSIASGTTTFPTATFIAGGSFTNADMFTRPSLLRFNSNSAGETITLGGDNTHSLEFNGSGSWTITDINATSTGDVTITSGSVTGPSGSFAVGRSFDNNAGGSAYNANAGLAYFFATTTGHTIDPGGALFANVEVKGASGGWIVQSATSSGYWTISQASSYTQAASSDLEVQGIFTNLIGGSATDWSSSRLYLNASGTSYTINTKLVGGDQYENLELGPNTDVRMWDSAATTTTVHASSSLYSQDHAAVSGDLFIWGEYVHASGNDWWSYNFDFDGTDISGSPRQVDVRVASGSDMTFSGGQLHMVGISSATTTIEVQGGSGEYAWEISGGNLNAQYYQIRNTDTNGLQLSGVPTIANFENGDFELSNNGGTMLTVASTTLDANPTKTYLGMRFATSSGISIGYNAVRSGTSTNTWNFQGAYGNYASEAFDLDGIDLCSSFRWDDSTCLEVAQTHYRFRNDDGGEGAPDDEWYDSNWSHRQRITVFNSNSSELSKQPIKFDITFDGDMQSDFDDLRFTDASGTTTISYWVEDVQTSATATVWVNVPSVPANGTAPIYMYYGNAGVSTADVGTTTFPLFFDDFEDNDIDEYSGETGLFSGSASFNYEGSYGLAGTALGKTDGGIYRAEGSTSTATGTTMRWFQYLDATADDEPCTVFALQSPASGDDNYAVCLDQFSSDTLVIAENVRSNEEDDPGGSAGTSVLVRENASYGTGWYEVEVDWLANGDILASVYSATSGELIVATSTNDTTYSSGGIGFTYWFQSGGWDAVMVRPYIATEPTYRFSAEQQDSGATWKEDQDMPLGSQVAESNFRVRISVENSGPPITSQLFALEYSAKTGFATCEAVPLDNYVPVPVQGSCGVSDDICLTASPQFTDQTLTTQHLDTDFDGNFVNGRMVESPSDTTNSIDIGTNRFVEVEYSIEMTSNATEPSYCVRVSDDGTDLDNYARIPEIQGRFVPSISNWNLNADMDIVLTEGTTTTVVATGTVSDSNGYTDIVTATSSIYRSGVAGANLCTDDDNNCYRLASSTSECARTNCSGNSCDITCTIDMQYFAERTDLGTYAAETWEAFLFVADGNGDVATTTAMSIDVLTTRALDITTSDIDFGVLNVGDDTGSTNATSTMQNTGNENIDVQLAGSDLAASGSSIPVGNLKYASSTFNYSACAICNFLATTTTNFEVDLPKATSSSTPITDDLFWGIFVPTNTGGLQHFGTTSFTAIGD